MLKRVAPLALLPVLVLGCGGNEHRGATARTAPSTIVLTPQSHGSTEPEDVQLTAKATYPDGSERDVTSEATWSAAPGYFGGTAAVSASGLFHWTSATGYRDQVMVTATLDGASSGPAFVNYSRN